MALIELLSVFASVNHAASTPTSLGVPAILPLATVSLQDGATQPWLMAQADDSSTFEGKIAAPKAQPKPVPPAIARSRLASSPSQADRAAATLNDSPVQWMQGLSANLPWSILPPVAVVPVENPRLPFSPESLETLSSDGQSAPPLEPDLDVRDCVASNEMALTQSPKPVFQVQVKGKQVAELPTQSAAKAIAQRLQQVLESATFDPETLHPALVDGEPAGKAGDDVLFTIDSTLAKSFNRSSDLLAIAWVNHLRSAYDLPPLPLVDAQRQMWGLEPTGKQLKGTASWYGPYLHGNLTATGEPFNPNDLTAAHPSLPFDTFLKVTNLETGNEVIVRINDRGPYSSDRSLDLSAEAARCLDGKVSGVIRYQAVVMEPINQEAPSLTPPESPTEPSTPAATSEVSASSSTSDPAPTSGTP